MTTTTEPAGPAGKTPGRSGGLSPRKRQQIIRYVQYAVFVGLVVVAALLADWPRLSDQFLNFGKLEGRWGTLFTTALKNTIIYTLLAYAVGMVIGLVVALMRLSQAAPYRWFALVFIEIFRGLPALLILVLFAFVLPVAFPIFANPPGGVYFQVAVGLGLVGAAYMAETIRAGIQAVPKGQLEAARSLGMSRGRAMISIVIPQAFRIVIPPLTNELVLMFKDSSLVFALGVTANEIELTKFGESISIEKVNPTPIIAAGLAYLIITIPLGFVVRRLEARQAKAR
ncbi:amino acid ABC transporter permease [Actinomadura rudentiformis]|uniref:Amino acid ABC transporter permease n=1 Tax=Actinomadura rudentiformis TaxID=359158 RepID=A0A6H9YDF1_9ACTN|nr:amino acid ABC transporter permease [Actinomadura rudentiformis]KAB2343326.1 amino acid ABC transporter permease [Actinomadura rudentiformis]